MYYNSCTNDIFVSFIFDVELESDENYESWCNLDEDEDYDREYNIQESIKNFQHFSVR